MRWAGLWPGLQCLAFLRGLSQSSLSRFFFPWFSAKENSSQQLIFGLMLLVFVQAVSSVRDALLHPIFLEKFPLELRDLTQRSDFQSLPLFPGCGSVLPAAPTAASGTSMNPFTPLYCSCLFSVSLAFWSGRCGHCSGQAGSHSVLVNQQTWREKERCWGGEPAVALEAGNLSSSSAPPAPTLQLCGFR